MTPQSISYLVGRVAIKLALVVLLIGCDTTTEPPEPDPVACEGDALSSSVTWETPEQVPVDVDGIATHADVAIHDGEPVIAFHQVDTTGTFVTIQDVYVVRRTASGWTEPVNLSQSDTPSMNPTLAAGPDGTLHLMWGERLQDATPRPDVVPDAVYYTQSTDGGQTWQPAEEVFASRSDDFFAAPRSFAFDDEGHPHIVLTSQENEETPPQIRHFVRNTSGWTGGKTPIGGQGGGFGPDIAFSETGVLSVTYLAPDTTREERDRNSVFVTHSEDNGQTWSEGVLVDRSGYSEPAQTPFIRYGTNDQLYIVWAKSLNGDLSADAIFGSCSPNGGTEWTEAKNLTPSFSIDGFLTFSSVAIDETGAANLVFQKSGFSTTSFPAFYLRGSGETWTSTENLLDADGASQHIGLTTDETGDVHVSLRMIDRDPEGIYYSRGTVE